VKTTLELAGAGVCCFSDGKSCLKALGSALCALLITDLKMPNMSGISLLQEVMRLAPSLPVVLMTGYGDIPLAVGALKAGAFDFIEKPLERNKLLSVAKTALASRRSGVGPPSKVLTPLEQEVLRLLLAGKTAKEIAQLRHRSRRTIEDERARIMAKLGARNLIDLFKKVASFHLPEVLEERDRPQQ